MLNFKQLFAVIGPDEDAIVYDRESGEIVLVVYRRFCPVPEFVEKADSVVTDAVDILKNVRVCLFLEACALYIEYVSVGRYRCNVSIPAMLESIPRHSGLRTSDLGPFGLRTSAPNASDSSTRVVHEAM